MNLDVLHRLIDRYEEKIDKNNQNHIKMLFDIWTRFNPNDYNIKLIDQKWSKS